MKLYCYVEDDGVNEPTIDGPRSLPENFKNVSNFSSLSEEQVIQHGWLPYEKISENKEIFVSSRYEITGDKIIQHITTRDKTEEEKQQEETDKISQQWILVRNKRDELLTESDKNVVVDKWLLMNDETKILHSNYRKKLRDIPQEFNNPFDVVFPELVNSTTETNNNSTNI
jgi:hypothetical protein